MRSHTLRGSRNTAFALLMALSIVLLLIPTGWKGWMRGVLQPLAWVEAAFSAAARGIRETANAWTTDAPNDPRLLQQRVQELEQQLGAQAVRIDSLERNLAEATGLRQELRDDTAQIIPAPVMGGSASTGRESITIGRGASNGVKVGDWVVAGQPETRRPGNITGRQLLMQQWLIGRVTAVSPYVSTVLLFSDPSFPRLQVKVARRLSDGRWQTSDKSALLEPLSGGRMRLSQATVDYPAEGFEIVLIELRTGSPLPLPIGKIVSSKAVPESPLHFDFEVRPWGDVREISHAYVISLPG